MEKFIFTGHQASIDALALKRGDIFEADADWIRDQGFPAIPHELAHAEVADEVAEVIHKENE